MKTGARWFPGTIERPVRAVSGERRAGFSLSAQCPVPKTRPRNKSWPPVFKKGPSHFVGIVFFPLVSGKVLCGGQQTLSIQCRGGNLSGKRVELGVAESWAGAPLPRFSTMRDAHRQVRFLRVDRPSPSPGVSEMRGPLRRSSSAEEAFLLGSVLGDGLRATDLPREPAGHRSLPPIRDRETLTWGFAARWRAALWPTPTKHATGASSPSLPMS